MIEFKNVSKKYKIHKNEIWALKDVCFKLPNKGMVFITGTSGSGKTTLLNLLGALDNLDSGEIIIDNKTINKFKQREIDYYRNTYVGFVFQEYNLLDNFNVKKNVELALDLQRKKNHNNLIDDVLSSTGILELKERKINQLSGGQKQRVAIARALIKNPNMILADEPTGNLDSKNSEQIFELLNKISKDKLVVVVTHDMEFANKYADRIIEIKDGQIINDVCNVEQDFEIKNLNLIKSKLTFIKSISLSFSCLKKKKLKLIITTILLTLALSMFAFFYQLTKFDVDRTHAETLVNQNETKIEIYKKIEGKNFTIESPVITFTNTEIEEVEEKIGKDTIIKVSKAVENNSYLQIPFAEEDNPSFPYDKNYAYYDLIPSYTLFLEYNDEELNTLNLIGNIPVNNNEIVINKILADYMIRNGVMVWETDNDGKINEECYFPNNYEDIINDNKKIVFGSSYLSVSGIIDDDISKYDELKTTLSDEMIINSTKLYNEFKATNETKLYEVIVNKNFFDTLNLNANNVVPIDFYKIAYKFEDYSFYPVANTAILNKEIKMYNGDKYVKVDTLNSNEVILGATMLDELYDNDYSEKYTEYLMKEKKSYDQLVKEREEKIKEIEEQLEINPDYVYEYPEEIPEFNQEKLMTSFTENYIKEKQLIGKTISVEVNDLYLRNQNEKAKIYEDFVVVGYSINEVDCYFSIDSALSNYMRENKETISIYFYENSQEELEQLFKVFPSDNAKYISKTIYSDVMNNVENVVEKVSVIASYLTLFALILTIILFIYFSISSVSNNKKTIGILRALGAKTKDIYKIFYLESFLVGFFAMILSSIICYFSVIIANKQISVNLFVNVFPIIYKWDIIIALFILLLILTIISFIIPIFKIAKTKPVDIINNRC